MCWQCYIDLLTHYMLCSLPFQYKLVGENGSWCSGRAAAKWDPDEGDQRESERVRQGGDTGGQVRVPRPHGGQIRTTMAGGGDRLRGGGGGGRRRGQRRRMGLSWMAVVAKGAESGGLWLMKGVAGVGETATPMATRGGCQTPNIQS